MFAYNSYNFSGNTDHVKIGENLDLVSILLRKRQKIAFQPVALKTAAQINNLESEWYVKSFKNG